MRKCASPEPCVSEYDEDDDEMRAEVNAKAIFWSADAKAGHELGRANRLIPRGVATIPFLDSPICA
jgi:hypothetical protein